MLEIQRVFTHSPRFLMKFTGTYTALITPFRRGRVDEAAFQKLVQEQIRGGVDGIVPTGTTGESPTLEFSEHIRVIELAVQVGKGKIKVLAGTGANSTVEAITSPGPRVFDHAPYCFSFGRCETKLYAWCAVSVIPNFTSSLKDWVRFRDTLDGR